MAESVEAGRVVAVFEADVSKLTSGGNAVTTLLDNITLKANAATTAVNNLGTAIDAKLASIEAAFASKSMTLKVTPSIAEAAMQKAVEVAGANVRLEINNIDISARSMEAMVGRIQRGLDGQTFSIKVAPMMTGQGAGMAAPSGMVAGTAAPRVSTAQRGMAMSRIYPEMQSASGYMAPANPAFRNMQMAGIQRFPGTYGPTYGTPTSGSVYIGSGYRDPLAMSVGGYTPTMAQLLAQRAPRQGTVPGMMYPQSYGASSYRGSVNPAFATMNNAFMSRASALSNSNPPPAIYPGAYRPQAYAGFNTAAAGLFAPSGGILDRLGNDLEGRILKIQRDSMRSFMGGSLLSGLVTYPLVRGGLGMMGLDSQYQTRQRHISGLTEIPRNQLPELNNQARRVARRYGIDPMEAVEGQYFIASTGYNARQVGQTLDPVARGAAAGLGTIRTVANTVTTVNQVYGKEASNSAHAVDVLTEAVRQGKGEADSYAPALGKVVANAKLLGISFEEVAANVATFTRAGVTANSAGVALNMLLKNLQKPSKVAEEALGALGLSADDLRKTLREKGLLSTLQELWEKSGHNSAIIAKLVGSVTGLRDILTTTGAQGDAYAEILNKIQHSAGSAERAFGEMSDTVGVQWNRVVASAKMAAIELTSKVLPSIGDATSKLANNLPKDIDRISAAWDALPQPLKSGVLGGTALLASAGPLLMARGSLGVLKTAGMAGLQLAARNPGAIGGGIAAYEALSPDPYLGSTGRLLGAAYLGVAGARMAGRALMGGTEAAYGIGRGLSSGYGGISSRWGALRSATQGVWAAGGLRSLMSMPIGPNRGLPGDDLMRPVNQPQVVPGAMMFRGMNAGSLAVSGPMAGLATVAAFGAATAYQNYLNKTNRLTLANSNIGSGRDVVGGYFDSAEFLTAPTRSGKGLTSSNQLLTGLRAQFAGASNSDELAKFRQDAERTIRDINSNKIKLDIDGRAAEHFSQFLRKMVEEATSSAERIKDGVGKTLGDAFAISEKQEGAIEAYLRNMHELGGAYHGVAVGLEAVAGAYRRAEHWASTLNVNSIPNLFGLPTGQAQASPAPRGPGAPLPPGLIAGVISSLPLPPGFGGAPAKLSVEERVRQGDFDRGYSTVFGNQLGSDNGTIALYRKLAPAYHSGGLKSTPLKEKFFEQVLAPAFNQIKQNHKNNPPETMTTGDMTAQQNADRLAQKSLRRSLQEQESGLSSYLSSLEGVIGKVRAFGEETEEARVRNEMMALSLKGVGKAYQDSAIGAAKLYDQMNRLTGLRDGLRGVFDQFAQKASAHGIFNVRGLLGMGRLESSLDYPGAMGRMGRGVMSGLNPYYNQAINQRDSLQEQRDMVGMTIPGVTPGPWRGGLVSHSPLTRGMQPWAAQSAGALSRRFGMRISSGYRVDATDPLGHPSGLAADMAVGGDSRTNPAAMAKGNQLVSYLQSNAQKEDVKYLIWQNHLWKPGRGWGPNMGRKGASQGHYNHVHVNYNTAPAASGGATPAELRAAGVSDSQQQFYDLTKTYGSSHYDGSIVSDVPKWLRDAWGPTVTPGMQRADLRRAAQGVFFNPALLRDLKNYTHEDRLRLVATARATRGSANKGDVLSAHMDDYDYAHQSALDARVQMAQNYHPSDPYADLKAQRDNGMITPERFNIDYHRRSAVMNSTAYRDRFEQQLGYGIDRAGYNARTVGLGRADYNPALMGIEGQLASESYREKNAPGSIYNQNLYSGGDADAYLKSHLGELRTQLTSQLQEGALGKYGSDLRQRQEELDILREEVELRKDQSLSEEDINNRLTVRRSILEATRSLSDAGVGGAGQAGRELGIRVSDAQSLAARNRSSAFVASSRQQHAQAMANYNVQGMAIRGGANPDNIEFQMAREISEMTNAVNSNTGIAFGDKAGEIQRQAEQIRGRYGVSNAAFRSTTLRSQSNARRSLGDSSGMLNSLMGFGDVYKNSYTSGELLSMQRGMLGAPHDAAMRDLRNQRGSAYARNSVESGDFGRAQTMAAYTSVYGANHPLTVQQGQNQLAERSAGMGALSAQWGAGIVQSRTQAMLQTREELRLASAIGDKAKERVRWEMELERLKAQGIELSKEDLDKAKAANDQAEKGAKRAKDAMQLYDAFGAGFHNAFQGFGKDMGARDRMQGRSDENSRYLSQLKDEQARGLNPGDREYNQASARHDLIMNDLDRTHQRGGRLGGFLKDIGAPIESMLRGQIEEKMKDYLVHSLGIDKMMDRAAGGSTLPTTGGIGSGGIGAILSGLSGMIPGGGLLSSVITAATGPALAQAQMANSIAQTVGNIAAMTVQTANITVMNGNGTGGDGIGSFLGGLIGNGGGEKRGASHKQVMDDIGSIL